MIFKNLHHPQQHHPTANHRHHHHHNISANPQHHHPTANHRRHHHRHKITANHQPLAYQSNTEIYRGNGLLAFVTASTIFQIDGMEMLRDKIME
ncbi:hypothetical protein RD792_011356 [Penstemon davidsonii]|uniref:Uncharacterized protein n=1 Tax=Penstemon davidsonii TaxID=160366 RepID=A0ABR0D5R7_9LAMI|nr:hypothetical protein RD792_011356 [Penstemon davidsonii]